MNKKIIHFIIILLAAVSFNSCDKVVRESHLSRSYVSCYYDIDRILLNITKNRNIVVYIGDTEIVGNWLSSGNEKEVYDELCQKNGDMSFNQVCNYITPGPEHCWNDGFFKDNFTAINIVSDADYDEEHPKNTSLNDIIRIGSSSPAKFIASGYKDKYDWDNRERFPDEWFPGGGEFDYPIDMTLSDVTPADLKLLAGSSALCVLVFKQEPAISKTHNITVTFTVDDGREFSASIEKVFD